MLSVLALTAVAVVEKSSEEERDFFTPFAIPALLRNVILHRAQYNSPRAVVHRGEGESLCPESDETQGGLVIKRDEA